MKGKDVAVWAALATLLVAVLGMAASAVSAYTAQAAQQEARAAAQRAFESEAHRWHEVVRMKLERNEELAAQLRVELAEVRTTNAHLQRELDRARDEHRAPPAFR